MGGGNPSRAKSFTIVCGLSPRGRGKLPPLSQSRPRSRSIPAWAGETYYGIKMAHHRTVYPRVGGGNHMRCIGGGDAVGLSPRGRGKRRCRWTLRWSCGSIPAWAGETKRRSGNKRRPTVYPRVGGGNLNAKRGRGLPVGLSPRGRGKPRRRSRMPTTGGSIPAWAGET